MRTRLSQARSGQGIHRTEAVIHAIKDGSVKAGDVVVLICRGPMGSGMEEIYQITSALKHLDFGKQIAVVTDARFSGVSTGACIGHVSPEALAGGPIGKVLDGDMIEIVIDRVRLEGSVNVVDVDLEARPYRQIWRPIAPCPWTRSYGHCCRRSAAAPGAVACSITKRSWRMGNNVRNDPDWPGSFV